MAGRTFYRGADKKRKNKGIKKNEEKERKGGKIEGLPCAVCMKCRVATMHIQMDMQWWINVDNLLTADEWEALFVDNLVEDVYNYPFMQKKTAE